MSIFLIFLIILMIVLPLLYLFIGFLFVASFASPIDRFQAILPKIIVIVGIALSFISLSMLPFDVWNKNTNGGLSEVTPIIWQIIFVALIFWALCVIPFALAYYESHDPNRKWFFQVLTGFITSVVITVITLLVVGISYIFLGDAHIPITQYSSSTYAASIGNASPVCDNCFYSNVSITIRMSFIVYFVGLLSLIGWVGFVVCGGCGMTALPLQCMLSFLKRPKRITFDVYAREQLKFATRAEKLIAIGERVEELRRRNRMDPKSRKKYREFRDAVIRVEDDWKKVKIAYEKGGGNPFVYYFRFLFGVVCMLLSFIWFVHMILYMLPFFTIWPFLNLLFYGLDLIVPILGSVGYAIFVAYLVLCVVYGNISIMSKVPLISVYPIVWKDTMTNAFLFNTGILLFESFTIMQFVTTAFSGYAQFTAINAMFNVYIKSIVGLGYVFQYIHLAFFIFMILGCVATIISICPCVGRSDRDKEIMSILKDESI